MVTFKKKQLDEMVGGDFTASGNDRNVTNNSEIETGPVDKPFNDDSSYEKGIPTTSDKVFKNYVQDIPWFVSYSWGGVRSVGGNTGRVYENSKIKTKNQIEEELLHKKDNDRDVVENNMINDLIKKIKNSDLTKKEIEGLNDLIDKK